MLQNYLNANLLALTDDGDFRKLKKSADDIAKKLVKSKTKIVSFILSAIDPDLSVGSDDTMEVKDIIIKNWSTFTTNAKDTPLTYIRAVMLEALSSISDNVNHSLIIWFASRNIIQYHKLIGKEKEIILEFLVKLGNEINQVANREWALSNNDTFSKISFDLNEISAYLINKEILQKYLEDASGPNNSDGVANFTSPNPYWASSTSNWAFQFAPRAAKGIKKTIDSSLEVIVSFINENNNTIQSNLTKALEQIKNEVSSNNKILQLRSEILWWKEAAYSSSTDKSYNDLDKNILGIILAYDYSVFIPVIYPTSVDHFLKETYKGLKESIKEEVTLESFLKSIQEQKEGLKPIYPETEILTGKSTLLNFINGLIWNKHQLTQFEEFVGIPLNIKITPSELATWIFHDFQLVKILNTK